MERVLVAFAVFAVTASMAAEHRCIFDSDKFEDHRQTCLIEASVTQDELRGVSLDHKPPEKVLCFFKCLLEKSGLLMDGEFVMGEVTKVVDEFYGQGTTTEASSCFQGVRINGCSDMFDLMKCFEEKTHQE